MKPNHRGTPPSGPKVRLWRWLPAAALLLGCKSDLNQQLLERELRYQEDQIYQLQDELQEKCARLDHVAGENATLRRQLGVSETDRAATPRPRPATAAPGLVPPAIRIPDARAPASRGGPVPGTLAPPVLDGVPPLPAEPGGAAPSGSGGGSAGPLDLPAPATAAVDPAARPVAPPAAGADVQRMSYSEGAAPTHVVVSASRTACVDANGDGISEGIKVVFEPRDAEERLVAAAGDVTVMAFDVAAEGGPATGDGLPIARWHVPAAEAANHFRRTSRDRGMQFTLPWTGSQPSGGHIRVVVQLAVSGGAPLEADATIGTR
jgi:hypothetical protein